MRLQKNFWIVLVLALVIAALACSFFGLNCGGKKLDLYKEGNDVKIEMESTEPATPDIPLQYVSFPEADLSIGIPEGWNEVLKSGFRTFVHRETGASIQVQVLPYDPSINMDTETSLAARITESGKTFVQMIPVSTSSYEVIYQDKQGTLYDYDELAFWDMEHVIRILCVCDDTQYEDLYPYFTASLSSMSWNKKDPIPEDYSVFYNENMRFQFGYPSAWAVGNTDTTVYATDTSTGSSISLILTDFSGSLSDLTSLELSSYLGSGKNRFMMKDVSKQEDSIYCTYEYTDGSAVMQNQSVIRQYRNVLYIFSVSYMEGQLKEEMIETTLHLFRIFPLEENINESEELY